MVQSLELLLDDALDARVRSQWRALAEAGLPSLAHHGGASNAPHVTLVVASGVAPEHEQRLVGAVADGPGLPLRLLLGGLVVFGTHKHVLARLVVPSAALLDLQARASHAWQGTLELRDTVRPGGWTPHVTLAKHLTDTQVGEALTALRHLPDEVHDGRGAATRVRRWDGEARTAWDLTAPSPVD